MLHANRITIIYYFTPHARTRATSFRCLWHTSSNREQEQHQSDVYTRARQQRAKATLFKCLCLMPGNRATSLITFVPHARQQRAILCLCLCKQDNREQEQHHSDGCASCKAHHSDVCATCKATESKSNIIQMFVMPDNREQHHSDVYA